MELQAQFMSCRTFNAKGKTYFVATFSSDGIGPFDLFVDDNQFNQLLKANYLQNCLLSFEIYANQLKLGLRLSQIILA